MWWELGIVQLENNVLLRQHVAKQQNGKKKISPCAPTSVSLISGINLFSRLWVGGSLPWKPSCSLPWCPVFAEDSSVLQHLSLKHSQGAEPRSAPVTDLVCSPSAFHSSAHCLLVMHRHKSQDTSQKHDPCPSSDWTKMPYMVQGGIPYNTGFCFIFASANPAEFLTGFYSTLPGRSNTSRKAFLVQHQQKLVA